MKKIVFLLATTTVSLFCSAQRGEVHQAMDEKYGEPGREALNNWMYGNLMNVKVEPSYAFPQTMHMHITTFENGKKKKETDMDVYVNGEKKWLGMRAENDRRPEEKTFTIFDNTQNAMIMLNEKEKTGMAMTLNAFMSKETQERMKNQQNQPQTNTSNNCKKTGRTKMIRGVNCEEYVCIDEERKTRMEAWINTSVKMDMGAAMQRSPMRLFQGPSVMGAMMEMNSYKNDVLETTMEVTDYNNASSFSVSTSGYKINGK
ncbi:MAG: hypothetical protein U0T73_07535 [Chitinophagales bacterium]